MTVSKTALTASSLAFALMFGGGAYVFMHLGSIAQQIAERLATETLGVSVSIGKLDVSLQDRTAIVHNLKIANPPGFSDQDAMSVGKIAITLGDVGKELITFEDIDVDRAVVNLEVKPEGTNLGTIKSLIKTAPDQKPADGVKPLRVILSRTIFKAAELTPRVTLAGDRQLSSITIPDIVLTGIGERENGILAREAIAQVWSGVMTHVEKAASHAGFYQGLSPEALEKIGQERVPHFEGDLPLQRERGHLGQDLGDALKNPLP